MSGLRGLIGGVAALALLEVTVSNQAAAGRVGGVFTTFASLLSKWLDPTVALVPDLRNLSVDSQGFSKVGGPVVNAVASTPTNSNATPRRLPVTPTAPAASTGTLSA